MATLLILADAIAVWISMLWSALMLIAMRLGMKFAPKENWKRATTWLDSLMIYGILIPLLYLPAIVFGFLHGATPTVASASLILVTMGVCDRFMNVWFGPIPNPYAHEQ